MAAAAPGVRCDGADLSSLCVLHGLGCRHRWTLTVDTVDTVDTGQGDDGHGWNVWGNVPRVVQLRVTSRVLPHSGVAQPSPQ